jgi:hypothetical protein
MKNLTVAEHLSELTGLVLNPGEEEESTQIDRAAEYIERHGLDLDELMEAASAYLQDRRFIKGNFPEGIARDGVVQLVAVPSFIIGLMIGLKHGVAEVPEASFEEL